MKKLMLQLSVILLLTTLLLFSCTKSNVVVSGNDPALQTKLQASVDAVFAKYKAKYPAYPGGIALNVISPKGTYFVASGMEAGTTSQTHFRAASNTKAFTATAILLLAQEGKLNVDAKITDLIPGTTQTYIPLNLQYDIPYKNQITILDLLQHNAGVYDITNDSIPVNTTANVPYKGLSYLGFIEETDPNHSFTFDELVGVVSLCKISYDAPRVLHKYSNTGYSILGKIIERVSGLTYKQFLKDRIVDPMGLSQTSFPVIGNDQLIPAPFCRGYLFMPDIKDVTQSNMSANIAEGNIITTPDDLSRFIRKTIRGEGVLSLATVNGIMKAIPAGPLAASQYACGIYYTADLGWGHNGAHIGYLSRMVSDPITDISFVAYTNAWNSLQGSTTMGEQLTGLIEQACKDAKLILQ